MQDIKFEPSWRKIIPLILLVLLITTTLVIYSLVWKERKPSESVSSGTGVTATTLNNISFWTRVNEEAEFVEAVEFARLVNSTHRSLFENKTMACFYHYNEDNGGDVNCLGCGLTNQLFGIASCIGMVVKSGAKKLLIPRMCTNGNTGMCFCSKALPYSQMLNLQRLQDMSMKLFGLSVEEMTDDFPFHTSPALFGSIDRTMHHRPLDESVMIMYEEFVKRPDLTSGDVLNIGFAFGRWLQQSKMEETLYTAIFDMIQPNQILTRIMDDWHWKSQALTMKNKKNKRPFIILHAQFSFTDLRIYPGCQQTRFNITHFDDLVLNQLGVASGSNLLVVGASMDVASPNLFRVGHLAEFGIQVHLQSEMFPLSSNTQLLNSMLAFWLSIRADYFIATSCESQFLSHILRIRKLLGKESCSLADITTSVIIVHYPERYTKDDFSFIPYFYPHPGIGRTYDLPRCKKIKTH